MYNVEINYIDKNGEERIFNSVEKDSLPKISDNIDNSFDKFEVTSITITLIKEEVKQRLLFCKN